MGKVVRIIGALCAVTLLFAACGEEQRVGSEKLLEFEEQEGAQRLGERTPEPTPEGTPQSLAVDEEEEEEEAGPTPEPTPEPTAQVFDVTLIPNSPYYEPGNSISIRVGVTLRVTNQDDTSERGGGRSFTDEDGAFHSGMLAPGESWTWVFDQPGTYNIVDEGLTFATATLRVAG